MSRARLIPAAILCALGSHAVAGAPTQTPLRGVSIAGAEFAKQAIPGVEGTDYTFNDEATFAYFPAQRLPLLRVPIRWERMQPTLFSELDADYLAGLKRDALWARNHGARILIDVHNYGRYRLEENGERNEYVLDNVYDGVVKVPSAALADLWLRLSEAFRDDPGVIGYGLMNEPHDMGSADWKSISQQVVSALRDAGDRKTVYVSGDSWSSAERWVRVHGPQAWIADPADEVVYEAHLYFDGDASGKYLKSYDEELAADPNLPQIGPRRLEPFRGWCESNGVRCFVGEFGAPGDDTRWLEALDNLLAALDEAGIGGTAWAGGVMWGDYALSLQPEDGEPKPQLAVLRKYASPPFSSSVSAAAFRSGPLAPGSLASAFGGGFSEGLEAAQSLPLPEELAGVRVEIALRDGSIRLARLVFVSPGQINYLLPDELPSGSAELRIRRAGELIAVEPVTIAPRFPALFAANGQGFGPPAGQLLRIAADSAREFEPLAEFDPKSETFAARPIRFRSPGERIFLVLYGTGFRNGAGAADAELLFDGAPSAPIAYIGPQPDFPGLDQVNVELMRQNSGAGDVSVTLDVGGQSSNPLQVAVE